MNGPELREAFLSFFESKDHSRAASSSLIPVGDPTLLLTTAGMVQFKPYFAGQTVPPNKRMATSQKSFRTDDIDEVGDATHLTLFEMLGNFSFGDYFKGEAMDFALEFVLDHMGLDKERCSITVNHIDEESIGLWLERGIPEGRIYRFGDSENWWGPAGDEGACGPNSEIHYDTQSSRRCEAPDCAPNCANKFGPHDETCERFVEIWNLVFMQYEHHLDGTRTPLPAPGVDTGMGLERAAAILQGVDTVFETDLFNPIVEKVEGITGLSRGSEYETDYALRVLSDHARGAAFLVADGVVPGNEGRGYVVRRVIRRAIRHARRLGLERPFLGEIAEVVIEEMGDVYPELYANREFILTVMQLEEERFQQAYQTGLSVLEDAIRGSDLLTGAEVFRLWDTYGFPVEMTVEIAHENGVEVDLEGFEVEMARQRERGRAAAKFGGDQAKIRIYESLSVTDTPFVGYSALTDSSVIVGLIADGEVVENVSEGQNVEVVLMSTPFYPEGGGQVGDSGTLDGPLGRIDIDDTQNVMARLIVHFGTVSRGRVALGDNVDAYVDPVRREDTARNHTATHLLHAALRQVLGPHVRQAGSLVAPDRLRFDFTHVQAMTDDELRDTQFLVNEKIRQNAKVLKDEDSYTRAIERGALAFFGEKYEEKVRLIEIANGDTFSFEVCGGTHVGRTGEVGSLFLLGESSIGAGIRRVEAVSGRAAERTFSDRHNQVISLAGKLQTGPVDLEARLQALLEENAALRRERDQLRRRISLQSAESLLDAGITVEGVSVLAVKVQVETVEALREMSDWLRDKLGSGVVVLGAVVNDRPSLIAMVTQDLLGTGLDASSIVRTAAKEVQGGGGGRPDVAQAGGRRADKLDDALALVPALVKDALTAS